MEYFVSYAWGDGTSPEGREREALVDRLCIAAEARGVGDHPRQDHATVRRPGPPFMQRIGRGDQVFLILSDKYLRSPFCVFELLEVWRYGAATRPTPAAACVSTRCRMREPAHSWSASAWRCTGSSSTTRSRR